MEYLAGFEFTKTVHSKVLRPGKTFATLPSEEPDGDRHAVNPVQVDVSVCSRRVAIVLTVGKFADRGGGMARPNCSTCEKIVG